ncbi:alpha/beta hydrolase [Psychromicrobium sp. YIM B11713]|uniref:alpha/beta hydrolase n=1 Tax=Psychromicrobium sp. YIM B11713 TaxID=3145233 RepID=UPI00374F049A
MRNTARMGLATAAALSIALVGLPGLANADVIHAPTSSNEELPPPSPAADSAATPVSVPGETVAIPPKPTPTSPIIGKPTPTPAKAPAAKKPAQLPPGVPGPLDPTDPAIYGSSNPEGTGISRSVVNNFGTGTNTYRIGAPKAGGTGAGVIPAGLENYYRQSVKWESCADYGTGDYFAGAVYTCGYAIVPLDYSKPNGTTIAVAMLRIHLPGGNAKKQNLFMDPGGPGFPGMSLANNVGGFFDQADLLGDYDLIGFDPRGVGSSAPSIQCASNEFIDAQHQGSDLLSSADLNKTLERGTQACYDNTGKGFGIDGEDFIANVGTNNVVKDLDVLRSVVGDSRVNYLGFSYGTSIAYHYELQFPANIRSMIIDGVVNPFENNPAEAAKFKDITGNSEADPNDQIKGFQATFEQFMAACAENNGFNFNGTDVPCALGTNSDKATLLAHYQALSQKAWGADTYGSVSLKRPLSFQDFTNATIEAMYSEDEWPQLNAGLAAAKAGEDISDLLALSDSYWQRSPEGQYQSTTSAAFPTISCVDNGSPEPVDDATAKQNILETYRVAPFTDPGKNSDGTQRGVEPQADWCAYYKVKGTLAQGTELKALSNVLVISTTYDPATPYPNGVVLAKATGSTLLTVAGNDHTAYLGSHDCANEIANTYLKTLTIPTDITGATGVSTKDIYSKVITGNECQVDTQWRAVPKAANLTSEAGKQVTLTASGLTRGSIYSVTVQPKSASAKSVQAQQRTALLSAATPILSGKTAVASAEGTISLPVTIPADAAPGDYTITVVGTEDINKVLAPAVGTLTLQKAAVTPTTPSVTTPSVTTPSVKPAGKPANGSPSEAGSDPAQAGAESELPNTGADLLWPLLGASALLVAGLTLYLSSTQRRRAKQH